MLFTFKFFDLLWETNLFVILALSKKLKQNKHQQDVSHFQVLNLPMSGNHG